MANVAVRLDAADLAKLSKRISDLLHDTLDLTSVMEDAAQYMKRSTVNRILRTKTAPNGDRWEALSEVTIELKGHDKQLFESGDLAKGITIEDVGPHGFSINSEVDYSSYMQGGIKRTRGMIKDKTVPAREFMGFSDENKRRISKLIRDYLAHGGD